MRVLTILALLMVTCAAYSSETYFSGSTQITKLQAMRKLIENQNASILRCNEVILTEKATLKNKPRVAGTTK